jgi:hypothetical protein
MRSYLRETRSTMRRYFVVAACIAPWAIGAAAIQLMSGPSTLIRAATIVLGLATAAVVTRRLSTAASPRLAAQGFQEGVSPKAARLEIASRDLHSLSSLFAAAERRWLKDIVLVRTIALPVADRAPDCAFLTSTRSNNSVSYVLVTVKLTARDEAAGVTTAHIYETPEEIVGTSGIAKVVYAN